jgi:hypothetical protein
MSLFKVINNEALDEDRMASRIVRNRIIDNNKDNIEKTKPNVKFDSVMRNTFRQNVALMEKYIYKLFGYIASRNVYKYKDTPTELNLGDLTAILSDIIITYNNISMYLKKINYAKLMPNDKQLIDNTLQGFVPLLAQMEDNLQILVPDSLLLPISNMKNDILLKNYGIVSYLSTGDAKLDAQISKQYRGILRKRKNIGAPFTKKDLEAEEGEEEEEEPDEEDLERLLRLDGEEEEDPEEERRRLEEEERLRLFGNDPIPDLF